MMADETKYFNSKKAVFIATALSEMSCEIRLQQLRALFASLL